MDVIVIQNKISAKLLPQLTFTNSLQFILIFSFSFFCLQIDFLTEMIKLFLSHSSPTTFPSGMFRPELNSEIAFTLSISVH